MSKPYDFEAARREWSHPPFTGYGYFSTQELLDAGDDDRIREMMDLACKARYEGIGHEEWNAWMDYPSAAGKVVLDYGCGTGCEALQYAKQGAGVILADIAEANVKFAAHVMRLYGFGHLIADEIVIAGEYPFARPQGDFLDIFHSCGVLCATPQLPEVMRRAAELLPEGGEARLMLYSEHSWHGANRDIHMDVSQEPEFEEFVRRMDTVGLYADWNSEERLKLRLGEKWNIEFHGIMTEIPDFCISRLRRV